MSSALEELLRHRAALRTVQATSPSRVSLPTGYLALDSALPDGGWRLGALSEILYSGSGEEALHLVSPALAQLSHAGAWLACIAPPHLTQLDILTAHGVDPSRLLLVHPRPGADGLHAVERALRSETCGAVLAWPETGDADTLSQLQRTATKHKAWGVLLRRARTAAMRSPAALRLRVSRGHHVLSVEILRCDDQSTAKVLEVPVPIASSSPPAAPPLARH